MKSYATCLVACMLYAVAVPAMAQDCMPGTMGAPDIVDDDGKSMVMPMQDHDGMMPGDQSGVMSEYCEELREAGRLFQERCIFCHASAAELARSKLILKEDGLYGRYSEQKTTSFLMTHARLAPSQVPMMVEFLEWELTQR